MAAAAVGAALLVLAGASPAEAAPVTIDFESGAAPNEQVTNQYCCPGSVDKGPTFMQGTGAGFTAGSQPSASGISCNPPYLDASDQAYSGTRTISLVGCAGGEFTGSAAFFKLNWPTDSVEFQVGLPTVTPSSCPNFICAEIWTTAFRADRSIVMQQQTLLGPNTSFKTVPLISAQEDIAYVAIERGSREFPTDSATGVSLTPLSPGSGYLVVDDLTYDPPSSPPESSFLLGASPPTVRLAPGTESPQIKIPITWTANPNPSESPVSLELTAPAGVTGSFSPNPTSSGESILTLDAAKSATPGKYTVTVDGYVDKGESSEKHSSVQIPLEVTEPFIVDPLSTYTVGRCTPADVPIRIAKDPGINDPIQVDAFIEGGSSKFVGTSAGSIIGPHHVSATLNQPGGEAKMTVTVGIDLDALAEDNPISIEAAPSGYAARESKGKIAIEPIRIDSVAPGTANTPQRRSPGTLMTVKGLGFCPGDKVAIGPIEDTANPESISTPGKTLTFRVPRAAVSGPLRILPLKGTPLTGPMFQVSSFRNTLGYSWVNGDYGMRLTGEMMDEFYGKYETNIEVFGWLVRKPEAGLLGEITNKHIPKGICFGMAFGVAQMFDSPNWVYEFPRSGSTPWSLNDPKMPSNPLLRFITQRFSLQFTDEVIPIITGQLFGQSINAHDPSRDIEEIRSLVGPTKPPLLLGMISWKSGFGGHTVIAYDWEPGPNDTTILYVYNPNAPYVPGEASTWSTHLQREFTESQIVVNNTDSHWTFPELGWEGADNNLIIFPHDSLPILNGKSPHMPNVAVALGIAALGAFADSGTQVEDDEGHKLLKGGEPTQPKEWPKGVAPYGSFTGTSGPLQLLATDSSKAGRITATVRRGKKGGAMQLPLPGVDTSLQAHTDAGQVDHVTIDYDAGAIDYRPGAGTALEGTLIAAPRGGAASAVSSATRSEHLARFATTSRRGGGDRIGFSHGRAFSITHEGAPAGLSLTLQSFGKKGLPVAVRLPKFHLARGARLSAAPTDWRRLRKIRITTTIQGRKSTRLVKGHPLGRRFATIRKAKPAGGGSRIALSLRLRHAPKGSWVSPVVEALRHGKVVARTRPAQLSGSSMKRASLPLSKRLRPGRYRLRVRVLETVTDGLVQGSVVVRKRFSARVR
jgi:hypothetical protein